uniref:NADH:ubiquinone reductase (H(+)-translocating) n=1 Tax=Clavelina oblonga TaxID=286222 RepID=A0A024FS45_9ASCI|nr:NADH dehydrogenase subunit 5 [Clavelina oblonga]CAL24383.1 NADH dehydrogenase subunit 5 [Clavelina oblonga]
MFIIIIFFIIIFYLMNKNKVVFTMLKILFIFLILFIFFWILELFDMKILFLGNLNFLNNNLTLYMDFYSGLFVGLLIIVGGSILSYSKWYFGGEVGLKYFMIYMMFFMTFMMILVSSHSFFLLMVGWEGVGIMSYLLIGWWMGRSEASVSAMQAVYYNRLGDLGFMFFMVYALYFGGKLYVDSYFYSYISFFLSFFIMIGIIAKSSQFIFHSWLPNAMEGPTPVSSLLHSSTMVVAGVFLLIRMIESFNILVLELLMFLGGVTMLFGAVCAFGQSDLKKIIAYSTTSQLGLMILNLSIGNVALTFFHLCMHAFFKSMLFMGAGVFIHGASNNQDIRDFGNVFFFTKLCNLGMLVSSFSLMGMPFLCGYYSKDLILENTWGPVMNRFSFFLFFLASVFTVAYSFRMIFIMFSSFMKNTKYIKMIGQEKMGNNFGWFFTLTFFSILSGMILNGMLFKVIQEEYLSVSMKISPFFVIFFGFLMSFMIYLKIFLSGKFGKTFYYNPLFHSMYTFTVKKVTGFLWFFEFIWVEFMCVLWMQKIMSKFNSLNMANRLYIMFLMLGFFMLLYFMFSFLCM